MHQQPPASGLLGPTTVAKSSNRLTPDGPRRPGRDRWESAAWWPWGQRTSRLLTRPGAAPWSSGCPPTSSSRRSTRQRRRPGRCPRYLAEPAALRDRVRPGLRHPPQWRISSSGSCSRPERDDGRLRCSDRLDDGSPRSSGCGWTPARGPRSRPAALAELEDVAAESLSGDPDWTRTGRSPRRSACTSGRATDGSRATATTRTPRSGSRRCSSDTRRRPLVDPRSAVV